MNILFIMYDQLRFDYLSCAGHPHLETPNFDRVASMGVQFSQSYVQSPICGASRMCFYTGRYVASHGANWNNTPLRVGEMTMGDHLRKLGVQSWLIGKTHMAVDAEGMERLGLSPDSVIGARQAECGFDVWVRDDGLWAEGPDGWYDKKDSVYNAYLKDKQYDGDNPWHDYANSGIDGDEIASGWFLKNVLKPANIREEDSETPWLTREALAFMDQTEGPWCAHLSYIKPHWPYIVPAPYHDMYGPEHVVDVARHDCELENTHPVFKTFLDKLASKTLNDLDVRSDVIRAYMGLIKQCDDQLGVILDTLEANDTLKDTMIVLTSDHGDYLGDHWMGEKELFHDASVRVPMIIYDPRPEADGTRGTVCDALCESLDLVPTFVEAYGGTVPDHILEGRSLIPWLHGETPEWRDFVVSEYNYAQLPGRKALGLSIEDARLFLVYDGRYKLVHAEGGFRPMFYDLETDPVEYIDLGADPAYHAEIERMYEKLNAWMRRDNQRVTLSNARIQANAGKSRRSGIVVFVKEGDEIPAELTEKYRGKVRQRYTDAEEAKR